MTPSPLPSLPPGAAARARAPRPSAVSRWLGVLSVALLAAYGHASEAALAPASAAPSPTAAEAPAPGDLRAQVLALLARASDPRSQEGAWRQLGTGAIPILEAVAEDRAAPAPRRVLAVASLALVDPPQGAEAITALLKDPRAPSDVRASAAAALGRSLGLEAVTPLLGQLEDPDTRVREAVAEALGRLGGQQVRQALEDRVALEESARVREALQRGLTLAEP